MLGWEEMDGPPPPHITTAYVVYRKERWLTEPCCFMADILKELHVAHCMTQNRILETSLSGGHETFKGVRGHHWTVESMCVVLPNTASRF